MNTYVLLQSPAMHGEYSPQIIILDIVKNNGEFEFEKLRNYGWNFVGCIESNYTPKYLQDGFKFELDYKRQAARRTAFRLSPYLDMLGHLKENYVPIITDIKNQLLDATSEPDVDKAISEFLQFAEGVTEDDG